MVNKSNNSDIDDSDQAASSHHEFIAAVDESTDEDGSITYVEDYEINENGDDDGAFFVEYITEDDNQMESNDTELDGNQLSEYGDIDETTDELYNCNLCGMNFKSITDHIEKYHSGQDVLIDISDDGGTAVKTEKPLELNDYPDNEDENENGSLNTADNVSMNDGEMIVYGEESLENDNELLDEATDEDNSVFTETSEVYTYDDATGSLTRTTSTKTKAVPNRSNVCT